VINSGGGRVRGWWWPHLAETTAGDGMLMLQAAGLVHVTVSVRIICVKMSNKRMIGTAFAVYVVNVL